MKRQLVAACLIGLAVVPRVSAQAPLVDRPRFGVQVNFASDDVDFGVGAHVDIPMAALVNNQPLFAQVAADIFFPGNDITYLELNGNLLYRFVIPNSPLAPYAGAGLNFAYADNGNCPAGADCSSTDLGVNLVGGVRFPNAGRLLPFVQARFELGGGELFVLSGGVHF
jgi:opacity protein-like surface antigen